MDKEALDFQHYTLLRTLSGTLVGPDEGSLKSARQALSWALQALGADFDPHFKLKKGETMGEMLLHRSARNFNPQFMDEWIDKFGIESVFPPDAGDRLISQWISSIRKSLSSNLESTAASESPVLTWLLESAPSSAIPADPLPALADQIEAQRKSTGIAVQFEKLLEQVTRHSASRLDPLRSPLRWLTPTVIQGQDMDMDMPLVCPSGLTRTLGDLTALRAIPSYNTKSHQSTKEITAGSPSTIPKPPHGRKLELARHWILEPDIPLDTARARLWACAEEKPEAVEQLIAWMKDPPRGTTDLPSRIEQVLGARDAFGRGIMAWLACSNREAGPDLGRQVARTLKLPIEDVFSTDGAGLVEQLMIGRRLGFSNDAFHGRNVSKWAKENLDSQLIAGPIDRQKSIIDDLIDATLPFYSQNEVMITMAEATSDPRLATTRVWSEFFSIVLHPPQDLSQVGTRRGRDQSYAFARAERLKNSIEQVMEVMAQNPGALALGVVEWRQWAPIFLDKALGYNVPAAFSNVLKNSLSDLERIMQSNSLHLDVPKTNLVRPAPRL